MSRALGIWMLLVPLYLHGGVAFAADPDAEKGLRLAKEHCARCHVIGDGRKMNSIGSTPSFPSMVKFMDDWSERFSTFFDRPPHPAFLRLEGTEPRTGLPANAAPVLIGSQDALDLYEYAAQLHKRLKEE